nr:hypothetical protein [Phenylobacterium aquaticum]
MAAGRDTVDAERVKADLEHYVGLGSKVSGSPGDTAAGAWMEARLQALGFATTRQTIQTPYFDLTRAELAVGETTKPVLPLAIVTPTPPEGVAGRLAVGEPWSKPQDLTGAIALIPLTHARWSSAKVEAVRRPTAAALAAGAAAVILITTGPTGEAIQLNADGDKPMFDRPVAVLSPKDAAAFLAAAGSTARLTVTGAGGFRPAFNLMGRRDKGHGRWLVVSTPRSGWTACAGERGPGVAVWMGLADWASRADLPVDLAFVCNSGHEYENLGAARMLEEIAPRPTETAMWLHLGANVAARDWHELGGQLAPLPSPDPQRILMATPDLLAPCREAFAGQPGLEAPYAAGAGAAGELTHILASGYPKVAGVFGVHRFHHVAGDDLRCVDARFTAAALEGFKRLIRAALA